MPSIRRAFVCQLRCGWSHSGGRAAGLRFFDEQISHILRHYPEFMIMPIGAVATVTDVTLAPSYSA